MSALEFHMSVLSQGYHCDNDYVKGIMDAARQSKHQQLISKFAHYNINQMEFLWAYNMFRPHDQHINSMSAIDML